MRSIVKFSTKLSLAGLALCLTMSNVFANTLSEVEINSIESGYGIVLKTDEAAQMKKVISSDDRMTIELKDVSASENLNTVYNNVANLDNVTIQPSSKSDIKIIFKGKDIAHSKVSFETVKTDIPAVLPEQSIKLNGPVSSYTPVYSPDAFVSSSESQTANPELNEILTQMHISREMLLTVKRYAKAVIRKANAAAHGDINLMTVMGIVLIIGAFLLRPSGKKRPADAQRAIGLASRENLEREMNINRNLAGSMNLSKPAVPASKMGYGMKAYQQSQRNPYMSANTATNGVSGIARRKPLKSSVPINKKPLPSKKLTNQSAPLAQNRVNSPIKAQTPKLRQLQNSKPLIQSTVNSHARASQSTSAASDLDSMKFLESITKIYEKNGRTDLAKGLKDNLRKAQLSQV